MVYKYFIIDNQDDSVICLSSLRQVEVFMKERYPDRPTISHNTISQRLRENNKTFEYYDIVITEPEGGIIIKE
jgi:hypothetical protein